MATLHVRYRLARLRRELLPGRFPAGSVTEVDVQGDGRFSARVRVADTDEWARVSVLLPAGFPLEPPLIEVTEASSAGAWLDVERVADRLGSGKAWTPAIHVPTILLQLTQPM
jgi:hypothetical protein